MTDLLEDVEELETKSEDLMSMIEIVKYHQYPVEHTFFATEDGHLLDIYRITGPRFEKTDKEKLKKRRPVLMVHGILQSSLRFVLSGPYS